jgi:hypothetical protein
MEDLTSMAFGDTLGDDGNSTELRELESLERRLEDGAGRGKVDEHVGFRVLLGGFVDRLVDGKEDFLDTPVELLDQAS